MALFWAGQSGSRLRQGFVVAYGSFKYKIRDYGLVLGGFYRRSGVWPLCMLGSELALVVQYCYLLVWICSRRGFQSPFDPFDTLRASRLRALR